MIMIMIMISCRICRHGTWYAVGNMNENDLQLTFEPAR